MVKVYYVIMNNARRFIKNNQWLHFTLPEDSRFLKKAWQKL